MNRSAQIALLLVLAAFFALLSALLVYLDTGYNVWGALNVIVAIDKVLGSWTIVPPALSWAIIGFFVGGLCYFAIWETNGLGQRRRRFLYLLLAILILSAGPIVWPRLEVALGAPMLWWPAKTTPRAGEERTFANMQFVWAPPGRFMMGSPVDEPGRRKNEQRHVVTLRRGFWIGKYEVTQAQWKAVMKTNPSYFNKGDDSAPVDSVTLNECHEFVAALNAKVGNVFRLPTESEWEYACRAGSRGAYAFGDDASQLAAYAWFKDNSEHRPHPVGQKMPNPWGLYDTYGNVLEWCEDWYDFYPDYRVTDPTGPAEGTIHILRGGGWGSEPQDCRSSSRELALGSYPQNDYHYGLRLVRVAD
jgi:formylglycine-generating enzyme required for sulfatase activity